MKNEMPWPRNVDGPWDAPAGSVNMKNGAAAQEAIRESAKAEAPRLCINQVAAMSCAETNVPDKALASQRRQNTGFLSANQVEADVVFIANGIKREKLFARPNEDEPFP